MFEDFRNERSLILLLSLTGPDLFKKGKFSDNEVNNLKNLALEKTHRQRRLEEYVAVALTE